MRNYFEHWERDVLTGKVTESLWVMLLNMHFHADTQTASRKKLETWAKAHDITLKWGYASTPDGTPAQVVHFSRPPRPSG